MSKMTEQDKTEFDKLYQYVKTKVLGYTGDMALPKFMVMRLKGLSDGKFYANNKTNSTAKYDYNTIYLTFVFCKDKIQNALQTKKFTNEQNKFNYIMAIVENNINDVVIRIKKTDKSKQIAQKQIEKIQIDIPTHQILEQPTNTANNIKPNSKFNNLTEGMW